MTDGARETPTFTPGKCLERCLVMQLLAVGSRVSFCGIMERRTRYIAGLLTFVALTFSLAEGVWASTCALEMGMSAPTSHGMPAGHDCLTGHPGERDRPDVPDCPFGPVSAAQGCVAAASLPAASVVEIALSPESTSLAPTTETERQLLLGSALFHPPKA